MTWEAHGLQNDGAGDPSGEAFRLVVGALYALTFTIKMSKMSGEQPPGYFEYVAPPLEGLCVQVMHFGPYAGEPEFIALMREFMDKNGLVDQTGSERKHHEIYMSDPRKVAPEKLKTVIRHPVALKGEEVPMAPELVLPLSHIGTGLLLALLGYLMKVKRWSWLIAGYNTSSAEEKAKYDTAALCNGVGKFMFFLGFTLLIASTGFLLEASWITVMGWVLFVAAVIVFLVYANTGGRYKK